MASSVVKRALVAVDPAVRLLWLEVVERAPVDERLDRHLARDLVAAQDAEEARVGHLADYGGSSLPLAADREHVVHLRGLDHREHPLLRLGDHDLERLHVRLAKRHPSDVDVDADASARGHLGGR